MAAVRIFTSPTCPFCKAAKELLDEQGVAYDNFEVTSDREALAEMQKISGGARTVPVIEICNQVLVGFDRDRLLQAINCLNQSSLV